MRAHSVDGPHTVTTVTWSTFTFAPTTVTAAGAAGGTASWATSCWALGARHLGDRLSATVTVNTASLVPATITLSSILYDVASTVPAGTFVSVGLTTSAAQAVLPATNTNAVVFRGYRRLGDEPDGLHR